MPEPTYTIKGVEAKDFQPSVYRVTAPLYKPSKTAQDVITNAWTRYNEMRTNRELNFKWFGKRRDGTYRTLVEYINICEKRWNSDGVPRVNLEDWQASVFKPETRNKVMAILAAVAQQRPGMTFKGVEKNDYLREQILSDLYTWSENKDNGDEMALYTMLDAIIHGTAIRYEGYEDCRRVIKELTEESTYDEVKFKEKTVIEKKLFTREVRLQDFFFGNMATRRMDEQPDCVWRKVMRIKDFKAEFASWKNTKYVLPGGDLTDETFFSSFASEEIREQGSELVEVLRYYSREADEFVILANGVWVNPLNGEKVCPLPFTHKELPFFTIVFEPMASDFPYGKALPDKMLHEQDAINALYNMMIDQAYVSIHRPLVTGDEDALDDVELVPGKVNYVGADTKNIMELDISGPGAAHFNMLQLLHNSLEQTSVDSVQSGQTGEAGTATEVRQASAAASRQFLLFLQFVFYGYKRQAKLRVSNILQFCTSPDQIEKVLGDNGEEDFTEAFQSFKVDKVSLSNGEQGSRVISMMPSRDALMDKMMNRQEDQKALQSEKVERIYITPEYIRGWEFDVEPIPDSTIKETPEVRKALELEYQQTVYALYPDMANREALFDELNKVFGKNTKDVKMIPTMAPQMMPGMGQKPTGGTGGVGNQVMKQATGKQGFGLNMLNG